MLFQGHSVTCTAATVIESTNAILAKCCENVLVFVKDGVIFLFVKVLIPVFQNKIIWECLLCLAETFQSDQVINIKQ